MKLPQVCSLLFLATALSSSVAFAEDTPLAKFPYTPSLDVSAMDRSVDPCQDLYQYSCGGWIKHNPIPGDQARWSVYGKLYHDNQRYLWGILQETEKPDAKRNANEQKIGDYFSSCMDTTAVDKVGAAPLSANLKSIASMKSTKDLGVVLGTLQATASTSGLFFGAGVAQDAKDSTIEIFALYSGGLGLPDRDYYLKTDDKSKELREAYLKHVATMFELLGSKPKQANAAAQTVMRIETKLAQSQLSRVDRRDPYKVYHRVTLDELKSKVPLINWDAYLTALGARPGAWLNLSEPLFFEQVNLSLKNEKLADVKTYLKWALVHDKAAYLSKPFVDENFAFYATALRGVKQMPPRWKKCVGLVDRDLGEALGKVFVDRTFAPEMKTKTVEMTNLIIAAMKLRITGLKWMSPQTKKQALDKLAKIRNKVGYPDLWRDYSALTVIPGKFFGNVDRALAFENKRELAKIGKPVDHNEWGMTPPTVNAYFNPSMNDINFPAGVLMPPLYDAKLDDAPNFGNTGSTIGHELTHGFDDEGRQYNGDGNLVDWWTKTDADNFEKGANCVRGQYANYVVVDEIKINSKLTSGEDIADLGGSILAWIAWKEATKDMKLKAADGLSPEQRFFVGLAQWACENTRPEDLRVQAATDPHSPGKYRINGVVVNMPEFASAFQCKAGAPLVKKPDAICKIW